MKKLLVSVVALLATAGLAMGGSAAFQWSAEPPVDTLTGGVVVMKLAATGDSEVDAMSLALEVAAPLAIAGINGTLDYFAGSNDGGAGWNDGAQIAGYDITNPSTSIHLPALGAGPLVLAQVTVNVPAGTPVGMYPISTVVAAYGDYPSALGFAGNALDVAQAVGQIHVTPEPVTALLLLGVLPFLRRRHA